MSARKPFQLIYSHDRRKHRHRCQSCRRIVNAGESVLMVRCGKTTRVVHEPDCADAEELSMTWRERFALWANYDWSGRRVFR